MTHFIRQGADFLVTDTANIDIHKRLPVGTFVVAFHPERGFYLRSMEDMTVPSRIYGSLIAQRDRILNTYKDRPSNTGVLLVGEKGSGKTMLARMVSLMGLTLDLPTIVINSEFKGDSFNKFMQSIDQECVVLFDEFEKTYDEDSQEAILTLLDGVFTSKKLFMLTCNDPYRIDSHMRNRPGRLFYRISFKGLEEEAIRQYCEENLTDKGQVETVCKVSHAFSNFNFDMLKALVEEMNRYKETALEAVLMLNMEPEKDKYTTYDISIKVDEVLVPFNKMSNKELTGTPLSQSKIPVGFYVHNAKEYEKAVKTAKRRGTPVPVAGDGASAQDAEYDFGYDEVTPDQFDEFKGLVIDGTKPTMYSEGKAVYKVDDHITVTFTRKEGNGWDWRAF